MLEEYLKAVDNLTIDKASSNEEMLRNQQALTTEMQVKDSQIPELKEQMNQVVPAIGKVMNELEGYKKELGLYREQYGGRHFTKEERKKIEEFREQMNTLPDDDIDFG